MTDTTQNSARVSPFLWFNGNAEEAVNFYFSVFASARRLDTVRASEGGPWKKDAAVVISFEIEGRQYMAFNGGPGHPFNDAISLVVTCRNQDEIDYYWSALQADGGQEIQCGWLKDKFGLSWQVVPDNIADIVKSPRAMQALMAMKKLDMAALHAATQSE